jgi:hypothetical protein
VQSAANRLNLTLFSVLHQRLSVRLSHIASTGRLAAGRQPLKSSLSLTHHLRLCLSHSRLQALHPWTRLCLHHLGITGRLSVLEAIVVTWQCHLHLTGVWLVQAHSKAGTRTLHVATPCDS